MHALRHVYATRAIESGMQPKFLQKLFGHAIIKTTMERCVHITDELLSNACCTAVRKQLSSTKWCRNDAVTAPQAPKNLDI